MKRKTSRLWLGLSGVMTFLLALLISCTVLANTYAGLINSVLGLTSSGLALKGSAYADEDGNLTDEGCAELIKDSYDLCVQELEEGAVLLKNDNNALPLNASERKVSLFGSHSANIIYRSGAGGPAPNDQYVVDMEKAFKDGGFEINQRLYDLYASNKQGHDVTKVTELAASKYSNAIKGTFVNYKDAAIITLGRYGTENTDPTKGIMALDKNEQDMLQMVKDGGFTKRIVLLNGPLPMELGWLDEYDIDACIWFGNPGYYGLPGLVNILKGEANPSGHNTFTFAANSLGAPGTVNFGDYNMTGNLGGHDKAGKFVVYKEGIYVGYKYYETRYEDAILNKGNAKSATGAISGATEWKYQDEVCYPFGFGLSYSEYTQKLDSVTYDAKTDSFTAKVTVKNTNNKAGKASVQLYAQLPYTDYDKTNGIEKSAIQLLGYNKADVDANGTKTVEVKFDRYLLASYDAKYGNGGYILEPGTYYFAIGNGAHEAVNHVLGAKGATGLVDHNGEAFTASADCVKTYDPKLTEIDRATYKNSQYNKDVEVKNQFPDADLNYWANEDEKITYLTRNDWQGTFPTELKTLTVNDRIRDGLDMRQYKKAEDAPSYKEGDGTVYNVELEEPISFADMKGVPYDDAKWDALVSQLSLKDLCVSIGDNRGIGGVSTIDKPTNAIDEGPEGLLNKFKYGDKRSATGYPTLPTLAASWDHELQAKHGDLYAEEALFCGTAMVNAPGCNIIRSPYSSRASEYFSEDSMLSYYSVSNVVLAMRQKGLICNVKHCFLNEQETNRQGIATFANEQSIREIYLRPFEGALTKGKSLGIMTSYNRIGLQYAACHAPLMQNVMRGEWGYEGSIIDDALMMPTTTHYGSTADMLLAGTNIWCLDGQRSGQMEELIKSTDDGCLLKALQEANKRIFFAMINSSMGGSVDADTVVSDGQMWWQSALIAVDVTLGVLAAGAIVMFALKTYLGKKQAVANDTAAVASGNSEEEVK